MIKTSLKKELEQKASEILMKRLAESDWENVPGAVRVLCRVKGLPEEEAELDLALRKLPVPYPSYARYYRLLQEGKKGPNAAVFFDGPGNSLIKRTLTELSTEAQEKAFTPVLAVALKTLGVTSSQSVELMTRLTQGGSISDILSNKTVRLDLK